MKRVLTSPTRCHIPEVGIPNSRLHKNLNTGIFVSVGIAVPSSLENEFLFLTNKTKQTPWPLFRERTILTERPPLVDEI
jgi:hypothetical protein